MRLRQPGEAQVHRAGQSWRCEQHSRTGNHDLADQHRQRLRPLKISVVTIRGIRIRLRLVQLQVRTVDIHAAHHDRSLKQRPGIDLDRQALYRQHVWPDTRADVGNANALGTEVQGVPRANGQFAVDDKGPAKLRTDPGRKGPLEQIRVRLHEQRNGHHTDKQHEQARQYRTENSHRGSTAGSPRQFISEARREWSPRRPAGQ